MKARLFYRGTNNRLGNPSGWRSDALTRLGVPGGDVFMGHTLAEARLAGREFNDRRRAEGHPPIEFVVTNC